MAKYFKSKENVGLEEVLDNKDMRRQLVEKSSEENPDKSILSFKLNIPGPEKINPGLVKVFDLGEKRIKSTLEKEGIAYKVIYSWQKNTGKESIILVDSEGYRLKNLMVDIEDEARISRLYDIDVFYKNKDIERSDMNLPPRKCFICGKKASLCARSRAHTIGEMIDFIEEIMDEEFENNLDK